MSASQLQTRPFLIGEVYRKASSKDKSLYLAITELRLLTIKSRGRKVVITPRFNDFFLSTRSSVRELCNSWRIPVAQLDKLMLKFVQPNPEGREKPANQRVPNWLRLLAGCEIRQHSVATQI